MKLDQINSARFLAADLKRLVTSCSAPTAAAAAAGLRHFNVNILHVIHHQTSKKKALSTRALHFRNTLNARWKLQKV